MSDDDARNSQDAESLKDPLNTVLEEIRRSEIRMERRLRQLEADVHRGQEEAVEKAAKRARRDKPIMFRRKAHREQFDFNERVTECLETAAEEIAKKPAETTSLNRAKAALEQGLELLASRQKLIKIADRSELGWKVVSEYEADELASDSEDEKKLEKAERSAERKAAKKRKTVPRTANRAFSKPQQSPAGSYSSVSWPRATGYQGIQQNPGRVQMPVPKPPAILGPCFSCGEMGHLRRFCPKSAPGAARWYPGAASTASESNTKGSANCVKVGNVRVPVNEWACVCKGVDVVTEKYQGDVKVGISWPKDGVCTKVSEPGEVMLEANATVATEGSEPPQGREMEYVKSKEEEMECEGYSDVSQDGVDGVVQDGADDVVQDGVDVVVQDGVDVSEHSGWPNQDWEYEAEDKPARVKGKLARCVTFWKEVIQAPSYVLDIVQSGYVMPFCTEPPKYYRANQRSALENPSFVSCAIDELLADGRVRSVEEQPHVCSPLAVVTNKLGKKRLVVNLSYLNKYLCKEKFKYEDLRVAMLLFEKDDYMFTFDLKSGYHHIDIRPAQHKYLGFAWEREGKRQFYVFTVLPFGLTTACYIFTKTLRPLVKYWRSKGIRIVLYLDDGIGAAKGKARAESASILVRRTLVQAGFVVHPVKCCWDPSQIARWLGFILNSCDGCLSVPPEKIDCLKEKLAAVAQSECIQARQLASVIGTLISMSMAIGPVTRLMTRAMYAVLESRRGWHDRLLLTEQAKAEIRFWSNGLEEFNNQPIWHKASAVRVVYSDASNTGYGGYTVEHGPYIAHGLWNEEEIKTSSTFRELKAVRLVLESIAAKLMHARVRWFSDNQNVVRILQVGSRKLNLQQEVVKVLNLSLQYQINLEPCWIPRESNQYADYLSRIMDNDDWQLNPIVFRLLDHVYGPHTIDRFASYHNTQLCRFNSRFWNPGSEAVDAFTVNWAGENNWLCPPIVLIPRVLRHAQQCKAQGTLVVPQWESAPFWPLLCPDGKLFAEFVIGWHELPKMEMLFVPGRSGVTLFNGNVPNTPVLALRVDFA